MLEPVSRSTGAPFSGDAHPRAADGPLDGACVGRPASGVLPPLAREDDGLAARRADARQPERHRQESHAFILPARVVARFAFHAATCSGDRGLYFVESGTTMDPETTPRDRAGAGVGP